MAEKEAAPAAPAPAPKPQPAPERKTAPRMAAEPIADGAVPGNTSNLIMISAILVLVLAAIGLLVALVIR
jgi:hypothetical protein